jgi:hypothetical protein
VTGGSGEPEPDYYAILRVREDATSEEIKNAYRRLASKYHPDINHSTDAVHQTRLLNQAYEILGNQEKKTKFDHGRRRIETVPELEIEPEVVDFGAFRYGETPTEASIRVVLRNHGGDVSEVPLPYQTGPRFYHIELRGSADPDVFAVVVVEFDPFAELEPGDYAGVAEFALIGPGGESRKELLVRCRVKAIPAKISSPPDGRAATAAASPTTPSATRASSTTPSVRPSPRPTPRTGPSGVRIIRWWLGLCLTVVPSLGVGYILAHGLLGAHVSPADIDTLMAAEQLPVLLYYWIIGSAAISLSVAVILTLSLRRISRRAIMFAGGLAFISIFALTSIGSISDRILRPSREVLGTTLIKQDQIEGLCTSAALWTVPSKLTTTAVTGPSCNTIKFYRGWRLKWSHRTPGSPIAQFTLMISKDDDVFVTTSGSQREFLESIRYSTGKPLWSKRCPSGWSLDRSERNSQTNQERFGATCSGKRTSLDPWSGR